MINTIRGRALLVAVLLLVAGAVSAAEKIKPFVLGSMTAGASLDTKVAETRSALEKNGFKVIADYSPYENAQLIVATSDALQKAAMKTDRGAYGAVVRVGVTKMGNEVQVAYVNPIYIQYAYRMDADLSGVADQLGKALGKVETYGSKKGLSPKKLKKYHYMFGMEYFDEPYKLGTFDSHAAAVEAVQKGLAAKRGGVSKVYRLDLSNDLTLFGVSMSPGPDNDKYRDDVYQMGVVDFEDVKKTAYLPYEMLVRGNEVEALHMRFRMAVYFPDLSMMGENSFMKVKTSPSHIETALKEVVGTAK